MHPDSITIPLQSGFFAIIDADDADRVVPYKWSAFKNKSTYYVARTTRKEGGGRTTIYLHRVIMNAPPRVYVDHINHDGLDNRKSNLRLANGKQNAGNKSAQVNKESGFRGVRRIGNSWVAHIGIDYKDCHLGCFATAVEAAVAYDIAAKAHFGEFATLNFP